MSRFAMFLTQGLVVGTWIKNRIGIASPRGFRFTIQKSEPAQNILSRRRENVLNNDKLRPDVVPA